MTRTVVIQERRRRKGLAWTAGITAGALLLGGSSFALWSAQSQGTVPQIATGQLTMDETEVDAWYHDTMEGDQVTKVVPEDIVVATASTVAHGVGENLRARLDITPPAIDDPGFTATYETTCDGSPCDSGDEFDMADRDMTIETLITVTFDDEATALTNPVSLMNTLQAATEITYLLNQVGAPIPPVELSEDAISELDGSTAVLTIPAQPKLLGALSLVANSPAPAGSVTAVSGDSDGQSAVVIDVTFGDAFIAAGGGDFTFAIAAENGREVAVEAAIDAPVVRPVMKLTYDTSKDNSNCSDTCNTVGVTLGGVGEGTTIDWGDGTVEPAVEKQYNNRQTHTYAAEGVYTATISGTFNSFRTSYPWDLLWGDEGGSIYSTLVSVPEWGATGTTKLDSAFLNETFLTYVAEPPHTVTDMRYMFSYSTFNGGIGNWDVGNVELMDSMFESDGMFDQDLSGWCPNIAERPSNFDLYAGFEGQDAKQPQWGSCSAH